MSVGVDVEMSVDVDVEMSVDVDVEMSAGVDVEMSVDRILRVWMWMWMASHCCGNLNGKHEKRMRVKHHWTCTRQASSSASKFNVITNFLKALHFLHDS
ncbi:hypothetical protein Pmani_028013 [Petrolisthes manimaculis]|uniref:Uncharacterized protein n=1 Tax=Petrolisthes manimaculis TaxID=1843537 RepID=A0AAE1P1J3_9EUCA|nr:hypothetical protein Pmani_028013 [Petrolisthes manimaculis]